MSIQLCLIKVNLKKNDEKIETSKSYIFERATVLNYVIIKL